MPRAELSGLARVPLLLLDQAEERGLDREGLMRAAGLTESELSDPDERVPLVKTWNLWRAFIERFPDPALGLHLGVAASVRHFGLVGYTMFYSRNLHRALDRMARYGRILSEALQIHLTDDADHSRVVLDKEPRFAQLRHPVDARLAATLGAAREITGVEIVPVEVCFSYPGPAESSEHERFFRAPLRFDQPKALLALRKGDLELPVLASDETLVGYLDQLAEENVQSLAGRGSFSEKVGRTLWSTLSGGQPTLKRTASRLGVSARTLQRRLREEGTSFGEILEGFREDMAVRLLQDRNLAVYEVAYLLGYSDPSTFYRAFRRWKGITPYEFRRSAA